MTATDKAQATSARRARPPVRVGAVPVAVAARTLDVSTATVRRWIKLGAPLVRRGRHGRGRGHLVDVDQLRAWTGSQAASDELQRQLRRAAVLSGCPDLLAKIIVEVMDDAGFDRRLWGGTPKVPLRNALMYVWHRFALTLRDELGDTAPVVEPEELRHGRAN